MCAGKFSEVSGRGFLIISALMGMFPVQNPFRRIPDITSSFLSIFILISVLSFIYPIFVSSDLLRIQLARQNSPALSDKIIFYSSGASMYVAVMIIRLSAFIYYRQTLEMLQILYGIQLKLGTFQRFNVKSSPVRCKWFLVITVVGSTTFMGAIITGFPNLFQHGPEILQMFRFTPTNPMLAGILFVMIEFLTGFCLIYGLIFIIFTGSALAQTQETLGAILISLIERSFIGSCRMGADKSLVPIAWVQSLSGGDKNSPRMDLDLKLSFPELFKQMKRAFSLYSCVGGWYVLALLFYGVMLIIKGFCALAFSNVEDSGLGLITLLVGVFLVFFFTLFGEFMEREMTGSQARIQDSVGTFATMNEVQSKQLRQWTKWWNQWRWKFTALNYFNVNHSTIPALRMSESQSGRA
ncbi:unnamed protein product [Allacma fusca]|uniref:Uncharacterized protein n=1 Tax=Allacma fusca TaxID=39272 RepID=A0A8J2KJF0_9HEXA|nr:unnamed protein product [Allacma fusca]